MVGFFLNHRLPHEFVLVVQEVHNSSCLYLNMPLIVVMMTSFVSLSFLLFERTEWKWQNYHTTCNHIIFWINTLLKWSSKFTSSYQFFKLSFKWYNHFSGYFFWKYFFTFCSFPFNSKTHPYKTTSLELFVLKVKVIQTTPQIISMKFLIQVTYPRMCYSSYWLSLFITFLKDLFRVRLTFYFLLFSCCHISFFLLDQLNGGCVRSEFWKSSGVTEWCTNNSISTICASYSRHWYSEHPWRTCNLSRIFSFFPTSTTFIRTSRREWEQIKSNQIFQRSHHILRFLCEKVDFRDGKVFSLVNYQALLKYNDFSLFFW